MIKITATGEKKIKHDDVSLLCFIVIYIYLCLSKYRKIKVLVSVTTTTTTTYNICNLCVMCRCQNNKYKYVIYVLPTISPKYIQNNIIIMKIIIILHNNM